MDATQLSAIRERVDAATPGPWARPTANVFRVIAPDAEHHNPSRGMTPPYPWRIICQEGEDDANGVNAEFIAHARTDVPALLDEVDRLSEGWTQSDEAFDSFLDDFALKCQEWDGDLTPEAVLEYAEKQRSEVERLHTALAAAGDFMDPGTRRLWLAALRTDPEEK